MTNDENYSLNLAKGEFKTNKPGKETRFFLRIAAIVVVIIVLAGLAAICLIIVNLKSSGVLTGLASTTLLGVYRFINKKMKSLKGP
jgi:carbon starvation protein CstA